MNRKDLIYISIILLGVIGHYSLIENAKYKASWCDAFFKEFRNDS